MKLSPILVLTGTAIALLAANWGLRHYKPMTFRTAESSGSPAAERDVAPEENLQVNASGSLTSATSKSDPSAGSKPKSPVFNWAIVEVADYKEYAQRLKSVGFPAELVRNIVIADVDKLYEAREQALERKQIPYDAPMSQRQSLDISPEDWQRIKDLRNLRIEKQTALENILGEYVPRELLRTPISRNYEAYEYAINLLPPEKRGPVQDAQETEIFVEGYNKTTITDPAVELESFKRTRQERDQAMLKALTPEQFERYEMNTTPAGTELARRVIGMQPSDEEFQAMFRIAYKNWLDTGGVYGRWRAMPVPEEQIAAANLEMNNQLSEALGPERFLDYQMAITETGQQMRNFAARFGLPRELMAEAFQLQTQLDQLGRARGWVVNSDGSTGSAGAPPNPTDLQGRLQQLLGPELWQNWQIGRHLQAKLDP